jgi:esterase/lipase/1-acyl-sn-glycerol-3-phosphate acyltransferase
VTGFIFKTTGIAMKFLESIFDSNLNVTGVENIPDTPVLFVANHFTRSETFILPYMMHKALGREVRCLADKSLFVGKLGSYLESMGTVATDNAKRNNIIIGDLLANRNDWIIYPEGVMVKNKRIVKRSGNYFIQFPDGRLSRVKTGAAVIAIKTELLKKQIFNLGLQKQEKKISEIKKEYFIKDGENICPKNLHIVPININYYPIRPGENKIKNLVQRFIGDLPARIAEELEIEGNLITGAEVTISFGKPLNIYDELKSKRRFIYKLPIFTSEQRNKLLINFYRYRLTTKFMSLIYENAAINMDHVFACSLYYVNKAQIERSVLKNLIYVNARDIKRLGKFRLNHSIDVDLVKLFMNKDNIYYDSVFALALKQGIIRKDKERYYVNLDKFNNFNDFHYGRLKNTLKIFVNQLEKFPVLTKIFKENGKLTPEKLREKTFKLILRSDEKEYFKDYEKYFDKNESKPREVGAPFFLPAKNNKIGVVLCHGYKASPQEVRLLADYLNKSGMNIYAVRLKGHATAAINMKEVKWQEWYLSFLKAYIALKQQCDFVAIIGFSTGGLLALLHAALREKEVDAVISINAAIKLNDIRVNFVPTVNFWNEILDKFNTNKGKKEFVEDVPENPHINYSKNYLKAVKQLSQLMDECKKKLSKIVAPALIIQADNDPVVNPKSAKIIYDQIKAEKKEIYNVHADNHVIICKENPELFAKIKDYIEKEAQEKLNKAK